MITCGRSTSVKRVDKRQNTGAPRYQMMKVWYVDTPWSANGGTSRPRFARLAAACLPWPPSFCSGAAAIAEERETGDANATQARTDRTDRHARRRVNTRDEKCEENRDGGGSTASKLTFVFESTDPPSTQNSTVFLFLPSSGFSNPTRATWTRRTERRLHDWLMSRTTQKSKKEGGGVERSLTNAFVFELSCPFSASSGSSTSFEMFLASARCCTALLTRSERRPSRPSPKLPVSKPSRNAWKIRRVFSFAPTLKCCEKSRQCATPGAREQAMIGSFPPGAHREICCDRRVGTSGPADALGTPGRCNCFIMRVVLASRCHGCTEDSPESPPPPLKCIPPLLVARATLDRGLDQAGKGMKPNQRQLPQGGCPK